MKRIPVYLLALMICGYLCAVPARAAKEPPKVGDVFPDVNLSIPKDRADQEYLGLSGSGTFKIAQVKARVVIVEIFSMYCPFCQREAPNVNKLYEAIETSPQWKGKIKIIGIGAGNSSYEVGIFKTRYHVPFPLLSDADFAAYERIGEVRTPYFIAVLIDDGGANRVIYSKLGALGDVKAFLQLIIQPAGL